ncbi:MAG: protein kinase [Phycisphaerales bacterium]|nr:protein kinase [Phycisphaerales bacterium]MCI0674872.1 protein kinase [Phycisphaerales bacterium]
MLWRVRKGFGLAAPCVELAELVGLIEGRLSPSDQARVESHLSTCWACRTKVAALRPTLQRASKKPDAVTTRRIEAPHEPSDELFAPRAAGGREPSLKIEGYEVQREIHRGGQGIVYKARQLSTNRDVAIKLLTHEESATDRQKHRFEREVALASSLHHSNIVTVYDSGLLHGRYYYVMEYVRGQLLDEYLQSTTLSVQQKLKLFTQICSAVSYAHQQGVTHRDLKPGNILVDARGEPHIVDFGLAKSAGATLSEGRPVSLTSEFMGTLAYAAPEQTKGDPTLIGTRTDVYALGVILFHMLTGKHPYQVSGDLVKAFQAICQEQPSDPSDLSDGLDHDIDTIVLRALAKEPDRRYQTVAEFQEDIERWVAGRPISARRDSFAHLLRVRSRTAVERHPVLTTLGVIIASTAIAQILGGAFFLAWPGVNQYFEGFVTSKLAPAPSTQAFSQLRVIQVDEQTERDLEALGRQEGFTDVQPVPWRSIRRLHGRLMEKLAQAGAKVVAWDLIMPDPAQPAEDASPAAKSAYEQTMSFNDDFVCGVKAMHDAPGGAVVMAIPDWQLDDESMPHISHRILRSGVRWGGVTIKPDAQAVMLLDLAVQRERGGKTTRLPSLALATLSAFRHPDMDISISMSALSEKLWVFYHRRGESLMQSTSTGITDVIELSAVRPYVPHPNDDPTAGLEPGDLQGHYVLDIPSDSVLAAASLSYRQVMTAGPEQLSEWFKNKVVLVGEFRPGRERKRPNSDGRMIDPPYAHAVAIDSLMRKVATIRYARLGGWTTAILFGAVLGVVAGACAKRAQRFLYLLAGGALLVILSVLAYRQFSYITYPTLPALSMFIACAGVVLLNRVRAPVAAAALKGSSS